MDSSGGATSSSPLALAGLSAVWDTAESPPKTVWKSGGTYSL